MESVFNVTVHVIPAAYIREYPQATANSQDDTLQLHVKQYTPKDNANPQKGDVSVIGSHANGFPKELYEPLWVELYHSLKQQGIRIRSIWAIDAAWQGQSGLLNRDKLGNDRKLSPLLLPTSTNPLSRSQLARLHARYISAYQSRTHAPSNCWHRALVWRRCHHRRIPYEPTPF